MTAHKHDMSLRGLIVPRRTETPLQAKRALLAEAARAYAHGACSLEDVEEAARDVERAKEAER